MRIQKKNKQTAWGAPDWLKSFFFFFFNYNTKNTTLQNKTHNLQYHLQDVTYSTYYIILP